MNFGALLADSYSRLRYAASPVASIVARVKRHANESHRELLALPGMMRLREDTIVISAAANQARTGLPPAVGRIRYVVDRTNNRRLGRVSLNELRLTDPGRVSTSGQPERYAEVGWRAVAIQPANASELFVDSTAAGDTGTVYIEGIRSNGSPVILSKVMTGTTAVSISTTETGIVEVTKFYLSVAAVGEVTLLEDTGTGTELARIGIGQTYSRYLTVEWDPIPTAATTLYVDYIRNVLDLVQDTDEPLLPPDFHYLMGLKVRMKEYEVTNDTRGRDLKPELDKGIAAMRSWVLNDGDTVMSLRATRSSFSSLGPTYPAGS